MTANSYSELRHSINNRWTEPNFFSTIEILYVHSTDIPGLVQVCAKA